MSLLSRHVVYNLPEKFDGEYDVPNIVEGIDEYDILCPVSKLTGNRTNPLDLLKMVMPERHTQFLNAILNEVPALASNPNMSDEDRIETLTFRLCSGTPAENEIVMNQLASVADVLFPKEVKEAENTIKFAAVNSGLDAPSE